MLPLPDVLKSQVDPATTPAVLRQRLLEKSIFQGSQDMQEVAWKWVHDNDDQEEREQHALMVASSRAAQDSAQATRDAAVAASNSARWTKWAAIAAAFSAIVQLVSTLIQHFDVHK